MKKVILITVIAILHAINSFSQQDAEGCKDSPMFPKRIPNYFISECKSNYNQADFNVAAASSKMEHREGDYTRIRYDFNNESGQQKPSTLQILKNYENAVKSMGGTTMFQSSSEGIGTYKITKNGKESAWIRIECGGNDNNDFFELIIVQLSEMKQEVTANDILSALDKDGHIALYINFETGRSDIKPESQTIISQMVEMLKSNPALKISVEGHTDNAGNQPSNQTLSENRAKSVMNAIIAQGVDKNRLSAKGWGQTKPIDNNNTEEGKAKNRRVEIVKL